MNIPNIKELCIIELGIYIINSFKNSILLNGESESTQKDLERKVNIFKEYLLATPRNLHDEILIGTFIAADNFYAKSYYKDKNKSKQVLSLVSEVLSFLHLEQIYEKLIPRNVSCFIYPYLSNMNKVTALIFSKDIHNIPLLEEHIINGVKNMKLLECFVLFQYCSDKIIRTISENCKNLSHMEVMKSKKVTDSSIVYLIECKRLKHIYLYGTSITVSGCIKLLIKHPELNIFYPEILCEALAEICNNNIYVQLSLTNLAIDISETAQIEAIGKNCPQLIILWLNLKDNIEIDLTSLTSLKYLKHLAFHSTDFDKINKILEVMGENIISLTLFEVKNVDLLAVNDLCPMLKNFSLSKCTFTILRDTRKECFENIYKLQCLLHVPKDELIFLLSNCINVAVLKITDIDDILNDDNVLKIFNNNKFRKLSLLNFGCNNILSKQSIETFLDSCKNLKIVSGLYNCETLSNVDLNKIIRTYSHIEYKLYVEDYSF